MANYVTTVPDGSTIDLDTVEHEYTYSDTSKIVTDTVIAVSRPRPSAPGLPMTPGYTFYYTQTYTYDEDDNLLHRSQWNQGDPVNPPQLDFIWQDGSYWVAQSGDQMVTQ